MLAVKWNPAYAIFFVGMLPLALAYYPLKEVLPPWGFVTAAFVYLVLLRLLADFLSLKLLGRSKNQSEAE